ncbi:hypothetical protein PN627_11525 [Parabacteroides distasonis]|uniref:hypothetical protein n=1 Tax=Bacteroidales TaxID=171549 RepID=UPI001EE24E30|nr:MULTISPECIES: hypothetical protein [Bacteroidales]MDB9156699.1 hypothetical protein [Parabacteroides distasonis]MDB9165824.1 hypothetical protein [Parabacteroides distasonis]MDB9195038.1 hypothetical protein [Parabacteroides distasonis]
MDTIEITKEGEPGGLAPKDSPSFFYIQYQRTNNLFFDENTDEQWYCSVKITDEKGKICDIGT